MKILYKFLIISGITPFILSKAKSLDSYYKWSVRLRVKYPNGAPYLCPNCAHNKTTAEIKGTINYDV